MDYTANRYFPKGSVLVEYPDVQAVIALSDSLRGGKPCAVGYRGKAGKPAFNYSFPNVEARERYIAEWVDGQRKVNEYKAAVKAERAKPHTLKVGDVLVSSWGYDQTNIDYYEVVRVVGPHTVEIRGLAQKVVASRSYMSSDYVAPDRGNYTSEPQLKRVNASNNVYLTSYSSAHLFGGEGRHQTASGWGH